MRNHHHKARDMARTALASKDARNARQGRRLAHGKARARERQYVHQLTVAVDPDEVNPIDDTLLNHHLANVAGRRQAHDNFGAVYRWVDQTIAADPHLQQLTPEGQAAAFAKVLGDSIAGTHAAFHVKLELTVWKPYRAELRQRRLEQDA